ncbi:hypothetical protein GDO78_022583 [Eleutherodactylus coqui]|uniref:Uncharacterized protein n=1 Tax=Eleutherodactylus coqui TaxID=57060 RepID=A0A8J6BDP1_ELECQ|nr:hypothetical protein GDO78_022583 [Eleutherodactylus coqui]
MASLPSLSTSLSNHDRQRLVWYLCCTPPQDSSQRALRSPNRSPFGLPLGSPLGVLARIPPGLLLGGTLGFPHAALEDQPTMEVFWFLDHCCLHC